MTKSQTIDPGEATELLYSVTGGGSFGTEPGVSARARQASPSVGSVVDHIRLNGRSIDTDVEVVDLDGRHLATVVVLLYLTKDVVLEWMMTSGCRQTGNFLLGLTPSTVAGSNDAVVTSVC